MELSNHLMRVKAKVLAPPQINYGSGPAEQRDYEAQWKLGARDRFLKPAREDGDWLFVIFDRCTDKRNAK